MAISLVEREFGGEMTRYRWSIETLSSLTPRVNDGAVEGSSNFWVCGWNTMVLPFKWNLFSSTFTWYYLIGMFFLLSLWMKSYGVTIQMKPLQQYFHTVLFIWYVFPFESVDEILWCYHSIETSSAVLSLGTIYLVCFSFWVCGWDPMVWPFKWNLFSSIFTWCYLYSTFF